MVYEYFSKLAKEINGKSASTSMEVYKIALGFIKVANETMARPIRNLTEARGHDPHKYILQCFGGAGGQHACSIARNLKINTIFVHKYSGILSAVGISFTNLTKNQRFIVNEEFNKQIYNAKF